ncbi:ribonuclease H-like domain-containing protein [Tanacetum coccineum]
MLAERKYPLTKETLEIMLSLRLVAGTVSKYAYTLLRFIQKHIDEHQELASPEANSFCKELASPKQTALGKDISNPLIVGSLLKTIWLSVHHVIAMKHWLFQSKRLLIYNQTSKMAEQDSPPPTITTMKIPIIKKGEYDIWSMRMRQYICHTDHNLWDIIVDGDLQEEAAPAGEQSSPPAPKTAKQLTAKRNQERAAIKSRFGGNDESKKMQRNVLKHQSENFTTTPSESLDKAYDRFQKLISQLEVHAALVSRKDINQKVYEDEMKRSLSSTSNSQNLAFLSSENTSSTNEIDQDDLEELDIRWQVAMLTVRVQRFIKKTGRNMDFKGKQPVTFDKRNVTTNEPSSQALVAQDGLGGYDWSNDFNVPVNYALMAISSSSSSSSSYNEVQNCSKQCLESFKTIQKNFDSEREKHSRARLEIQGYELALESLESKILRHEKNELAWGEKYKFQNYELKCRELKIDNLKIKQETVVKERDDLKAKIEKWEESSKGLNKILNSQMSAKYKNGLGYGTQLDEMSNKSETHSEISMSVFEVRSSDEEITPANDRFSKEDGYHAFPLPITGNFLTPRADISFAGLDEHAIRKKIIESKTDTSKPKTSETIGKTNEVNIEKPKLVHESVVPKPKIIREKVIIEDWNSDDDDDVSAIQIKEGIGFKKIKACFVCKSDDHLIKDCDFYAKKSPEPKLKTVVNTGQRVVKPVWDNAKRGNPESILQDHAVVDSGSSSHMTGNKAYLLDYKDYNGGFVAFGSDPKGDEVKFNLFSISQMCDKRNSVLFTDTECLILSYSFKLLDENQVVLRAPRHNRVYSLDLKNIVPSGGLENQLNDKVKIIRSDHGTEFKNHAMNEFCAKKGIKREFSVARTLQQNGVAERKNRTLIEAARTMLADSLLPILFWAKIKMAGSGPDWMFDLDFLTNTMNYIPVSVENQINVDAGAKEHYVAGSSKKDKEPTQEYIMLLLHPHRPRISVEEVVLAAQEKPSETLKDDLERIIAQEIATKALDDATRQAFEEEKKRAAQATSINKLNTGRPSVSTSNSPLVSTTNTPNASAASTPTGANTIGSSFVYLGGQIPIDASTLPNADLHIDPNMPDLEDGSNVFPNDGIFSGAYDDEDVGVEAAFNNMDNTIDVSLIPTLKVHKDHPKGQILGDPKSAFQTRGKIQKASSVQQALEEGIDYDEVFAPVARIKAIRLFLAFASFIGFPVYQMNVKSDFLYGTIEEELLEHVDDIIFGSTTQSMCIEFKDSMHKRFQMSSMATTLIESNKPLVKYEDGVDVDVHVYRSMIGSLAYLTTSRPDIMFSVYVCARFQVTPKALHLNAVKRIFRRLISWQCKKHTIVENSTIEAEYIAAANCCQHLVLPGLVCAAQKYLTMEMMFGLGKKMLLGLVLEANLVLPDKFGAARKKFVLFVTVTTVVSMANLELVDERNMVTCLAKIEGNSDFHKILDFLASCSIHHALTIDATIDSKAVVTEASIRSSLLFNYADVTPLFDCMLVPNRAPKGEGSDQPTEPQSTPSPTQPSTGGQPPKTSPSHATTQDSRDSLEGTDGNEGDQELSILCTNLSNMVLALESIKDAQAVEGRKKSKPKSTLDDSTIFDDQDADHVMEYMKTEEAVDEGRQSGDKRGNAKELVSTARPELSTARPNVDDARQEDSVVKPRTPPTKTNVEDSSRPARSTLTLKPLLTINPKDKGKSILEEPETAKKMTISDFDAAQIAKDAEITRQLQVDLQAEVERERQREEKASKATIAEMYDEVQEGIDADALFAAKLQQEEREEHKIEERAKFLA